MITNEEKPLFADVKIKWKNDGTTQDVKVTLVPKEEIDFEKHCLTDDDIFFYFNNTEEFISNQLNFDKNDFQIINVYNFY